MAINPFKQLCLDSITAHRATLDNMEQVVKSLPDNWSGNTGATTAGGGRGVGITPKTSATRHRTRSRAGGGRGSALGSQAQHPR